MFCIFHLKKRFSALLFFIFVLCAPKLAAVYEQYEYEVVGFPVSAGVASFTVRAWKQTEDGGGSGIDPGNSIQESAFVRLYNNGRLIDSRAITFLNEPGQTIEPVTVTGAVVAGSVSVRFINGYKQLNPGGLPALPQRTYIIYALEEAPPITPRPTPTPSFLNDPSRLPQIKWTAPVTAPWNSDSTAICSSLSAFSITALAQDPDSSFGVTALSRVVIRGPIVQPGPVTFSMELRQTVGAPSQINPQLALVTFDVYSEAEGVRYPGFRYPGVYSFTAQAFDGVGASPEITMTITVTDDPTPPAQSIQAMIVSGAPQPDDVFGTGIGAAEAILKGGIFTLGTTNLVGTGRGPLRFEPDQDLLTGQKIPPFIPWFYDVREVNYRILARTAGGGVVPLRNATGLEAQRLLAAPNQTPFPSRPKTTSAMPSRHEPPKPPTPQPVPTPAPAH